MGKRKIIVSERDNIAAVFDDEQAVEFIINRGSMILGDVYLASVENILPSIDAAFVHVGGDKMGFLHSSDVSMGRGDLKNRLQPKQQLLVQIMKEPTGHKGPRVTTNISLPGRFLVLMPESKGISISRKIEQQSERSRLKSLVSSLKPAGVGIIIRTEADQQKESDIQEDLETLLERWQNIVAMADTSQPPTLLYRDQDLLYRVIREAVTDDMRELWVDTAFGQSRAQQLLSNWNMDKNIKVQLYSGTQSILVAMGVDREIKQALQTKVPLPLGGYLYIQPTEALTVIDVNSGKFTSLQSQAETIRLTNLEAVKEIARQLRLRNIGGMIIIDFIDMESRADQLQMLEALEEALAPDKAKPQIGQLSDLGLVELTRHRQGAALSEVFTKRCIACNGTGHAIEELNWAAPTGDTRFRPGANRLGNRPGMRPAAGTVQQSQTSGRRFGGNPSNAAVPSASQNLAMKPVLQQVTVALIERPVDNTPLIFKNKLNEVDEKPIEQTLDEVLRERLQQKVGTRFASMVQVGFTPPGANGLLARINPKSNDVMTLIQTIQTNGGMSTTDMDDEEDIEGDAENSPETSPRSFSRERVLPEEIHQQPQVYALTEADAAKDAPEDEEKAAASLSQPAQLKSIPLGEENSDDNGTDDEGFDEDHPDDPMSSSGESIGTLRTANRNRRRGRRGRPPSDKFVGLADSSAIAIDESDMPAMALVEPISQPSQVLTTVVPTPPIVGELDVPDDGKPKRRRGRPPKAPVTE